MNILLISEYVRRLTKEDIIKFSKKEGIILEDYETDIIYTYIKKYYKKFIQGYQLPLLEELKQKLKPATYNKIEEFYIKYKDKI